MKKIMITLLSIVVFGCIVKAQDSTVTKTTTTSHAARQLKFYCYPKANVYYDPANRHYIYDDSGNWTTVQTLPSTINVNGIPRVTVYSSTPEVWQMNAEHKEKYKNYKGKYPKGKATGYKGTNSNKAKGKTKEQY